MKESYTFLIEGILLGLLIGLVIGYTATEIVSTDLKTKGQEMLSDAYSYSREKEYLAYLEGWNDGWARATPRSPAEYNYEIVWNELWWFLPTRHISIMLLMLGSILTLIIIAMLVIARTIKVKKAN